MKLYRKSLIHLSHALDRSIFVPSTLGLGHSDDPRAALQSGCECIVAVSEITFIH